MDRMRARNSHGVIPCRLLKACAKLLTCLTPQANAISFMLRNVFLSRCSACRIRRSPRCCMGDLPISLWNSCRNRVGERFTRFEIELIDTLRDNDSCMIPIAAATRASIERSEEHTSELQSHLNLVCRLLLE